ncbi:Uma2 family endonuclease [Oscillatoria salina]|uniref:Uma2 family endonuclease n=1 Tax=Oscillatoria salina TaxID=331517 RepID=UPI0013B74E97|nr:Uma2 family endonuclease [Oscillatoria salina]MBZ8180375.1 Uma2 family endonuclease [Oscillatoria salina IIICB1]NET89716.1 Uma2 family endonuclease [Kamptonema sp. SIO1D9]
MSVETNPEKISLTTPENIWVEDDWEPPMPPTDLIFDDGEPLESNRHRIAMNVLIRSLQQGYSDISNFFTGGNMFIYYSSSQARNRDFKGPDFFAVLNVDGRNDRQGWVVWEENGRYPDVIVELMSPSTARIDKGPKKDIYEQVFRTPNYFIYDPFDPDSLQGWHLDPGNGYQELQPNERGWLWCQRLGYWLGTWEGTIDRETAVWLRFYDESGNLVPLPEEAAQREAEMAQQEAQAAQQQAQAAQQQAQAAQQQAQALAAKLREMGIDPDNL